MDDDDFDLPQVSYCKRMGAHGVYTSDGVCIAALPNAFLAGKLAREELKTRGAQQAAIEEDAAIGRYLEATANGTSPPRRNKRNAAQARLL